MFNLFKPPYSLSRLAILAATLLALLLVLIILIRYNFYTISFDGKDTDNVAVFTANDTGKTKTSAIIGNFYLIPRSTYFIEATSDNTETRYGLVDKPFLGTKDITIEIKPQNKVTKVGKDSLGCDRQIGSLYYTYNCYDLNQPLLRYPDIEKDGFSKQQVGSYLMNPKYDKSYKSGLLSLNHEEDSPISSLQYRDVRSNEITRHGAPDNLSHDAYVVTDVNSDHFSLIDAENKKIYSYQQLSSNPTIINIKEYYNQSTDTALCEQNGEVLLCYLGRIGEDADNHGNEETFEEADSNRDGSIGILKRYNTAKKTSSTLHLQDNPPEQLCRTDNGSVYYTSNSILYLQQSDFTSSRPIPIASGVIELACGDTVSYNTDFGIYHLIDNASYLAFKQPRFVNSTISPASDGAIFTSFVGEDEALHSYQLNPSEGIQSQRTETVLPFSEYEDGAISEIDYRNNTLYIKPRLDIISDHKTGTTIIDESSLRSTKQDIEHFLKQKNLPESIKIKYVLKG